MKTTVRIVKATPAPQAATHTATPAAITTCDQLVKVWRPAFLDPKVQIVCVNTTPDGPRWLGETTTWLVNGLYVPNYRTPTIYLKRVESISMMKTSLTHEAEHATLNTWSTAKQKAFLKSIGETSWIAGDYLHQPTERFAYTATDCHTELAYKQTSPYIPIPGGCSNINYWLNAK